MKYFLLLNTILLFSCSSHLERQYQKQQKYFTKINKKLSDQYVIIVLEDNNSIDGRFIKIDKDFLFIESNYKTNKINIDDVHSLMYQSSELNWFVGSLAGFTAGCLVFATSGATIDVGGNSKHPYMILAVPLLTIFGAVWGSADDNSYKTIVLKQNIEDY